MPQRIFTVTLDSPVSVLGSKQTTSLSIGMWADTTAAPTGSIFFRVRSDESENDGWGLITVNTQFSEAQPALYYSPDHVETGVAFDETASETIILENRGVGDLNEVTLNLRSQDGSALPSWVHLNSAASLGAMAVGEKREVNVSFSPTAAGATEGIFSFILRVASANYRTVDIPLYVSLTQSGIGSALFKISDIYTGTLNSSQQVIQGLANATVSLQNEQVLTIERSQRTDSFGESLFADLPAGRYKFRVMAEDHQEQIGRVWIKPGVTASEEVFLDYNLVTVEWEVTETTIQDRYEIVLNATYRTDVPAAVLVAAPSSTSLPSMKAGDVYNGEFTITNHGFIRAESVQYLLPQDDRNFKYELLSGLPESFEAKQQVTVPFRVTCLRALDQEEEGAGTGGGCQSYQNCIQIPYSYTAECGKVVSGTALYCVTSVYGECGGGGGSGGTPGWGSNGPPVPAFFSSSGVSGNPAVWNGGPGITPPYQNMEAPCKPERTCPAGDPCCSPGHTEETGSRVDLTRGDYIDEVTDLSIKSQGRSIDVSRVYYDDVWHFNHLDRLQFVEGTGTSGKSIMKDGVRYSQVDTSGKIFSLKSDPRFEGRRNIYDQDGNGYLWRDHAGDWQRFDRSGRLHSFGDRHNVTFTLLYEAGGDGRLTGLADPSGSQILWYGYDGDGNLSYVQDGSGRRVSYGYDAGRLVRVVDVLGNESLYQHDSQGRLTSKRDPAGRSTHIAYNRYNFVTSVTDDNGIGKFFEYGQDGGMKWFYAMVKTSAGKVRETWFDGGLRKTREEVNGKIQQKMTFTDRTTILEDLKGNKTTRTYDEWGNLVAERYPDNTSVRYTYDLRFCSIAQKTDERGIVTESRYDDSGNLIRLTEAKGTPSERVTEYAYDGRGNRLTERKLGDANTAEALTTMVYDENSNLVSVTDPEGYTTSFTYDGIGNVLTRTDARGKVWRSDYDAAGRLVATTDPMGHVSRFVYDAVGNEIQEVDPEGKTKSFEYDLHNRLVRSTDLSGGVTQYVYNADGKMISQIDPEGKAVHFEYDLGGRPSRTIDGNGNATAYEYEDASGSSCPSCSAEAGAGNPVRIAYPAFAREYSYDLRGRKIEERDVLSPDTVYAAQFEYDVAGNLVAETDREGHTTRYEHDEVGRKVRVIDALNGVTEYLYDDRDNMIGVRDANGNLTRIEYDRNNRQTKEIRPMGQETVYSYDGFGNRSRKLDAKNQIIEYVFDDAGRNVQVRHYSATDHVTPVKIVFFYYNNSGVLTGYDDGTTSAQYTYDDSYRKISETVDYGPFALSHSYTYYRNGRKQSFTGPDGITYSYTYDNNNQLTSVHIPGQGYVTLSEYVMDKPGVVNYPGGTRRNHTYDPLMRMKSILVRDPAQNIIMDYQYEYDKVGNVTNKTTENEIYGYSYDDLNRITHVDNSILVNENYQYDAVGNQLSSFNRNGMCIYNKNNELVLSGNENFEYDNNGNINTRYLNGRQLIHSFDINDQLVNVATASGSLVTELYYDPFGRRIWKREQGKIVFFIYSDEGLFSEFGSSGMQLKAYGYIPNTTWSTAPIFQKSSESYYWYENDQVGTPQVLHDTNGESVWKATYSAFGVAQIKIHAVDNNFRFPGQFFDTETSYHYNWHRYYDPYLGSYLQVDPIRDYNRNNLLYIYADNNPLKNIDPEGLLAHCIFRYWSPLDWGVLKCSFSSKSCCEDFIGEAVSGNGVEHDPYQTNGPIPPGWFFIRPKGYDQGYPRWTRLDHTSGTYVGRRSGLFIHRRHTTSGRGCIAVIDENVSNVIKLLDCITNEGGGYLMVDRITIQ